MKEMMSIYRSKQPPSLFNLFTGGKTPELAIYFNTAHTNFKKLVSHIYGEESFKIEALPDRVYVALRNYLWKGYTENKNKSGYSILDDDKDLIIVLYNKLNTLRNFQSHVWHDHEVNCFEEPLYQFVAASLQIACAKARETRPHEVDFFYKQLEDFPHFRKHRQKQYITREGKVFFLSLFLTTGEMSRLMQQLKGSKRTDMPEFKIKHIIYKHFCHRDGSAVLQFHQEETFFQQMPTEEKRSVLHARQAYKIISYLNDIPHEIYDTGQVPLLIRKDDDTLAKAETVQDLLLFARQQQYFQRWIFREIDIAQEDKDQAEHLKRNAVIAMQLEEEQQYTFHITSNILHRLLVERMLKGSGFEPIAVQKFMDSISRRKKLYDFLRVQYTIQGGPIIVEEVSNETLIQYPLQGHSKLHHCYTRWLDAYKRDEQSAARLALKLLNNIRPLGHPGFPITDARISTRTKHHPIPEPQPIVPHWHDFFSEEKQKPRKENQFVRFAVHYLINHNLVPSWYWQVETFAFQEKEGKNVLQKQKVFSRNLIPEDQRLTLINDHVLVGISKTGQDADISTEREHFYQFLIGPKALRYLICCHILATNSVLNSADKRLENFLSGAIISDYKKLLKGSLSSEPCTFESLGCSLLEPQHVPELFHKKLNKSANSLPGGITAELRKTLNIKLIGRIDAITTKLDKQLQYPHRLMRSEKNRIIMQCYTLFHWEPKFLRKNEYNEMSICHYLIDDREKFNHLFYKQFELSKRVPQEVLSLLKHSKTLDELLHNTIRSIKDLLTITKQKAADNILNKDELGTWYRRLGLPVPDELITLGERDAVDADRNSNLLLLPFDIHPSLVLKYYYSTDYQNQEFKKRSPLAKLREEKYTRGLYMEHYPAEQLQAYYHRFTTADGNNKAIHAIVSKLTHNINTTLAEDAMLWHMARVYLQNSSITSSIGNAIKAALNTDSGLHVGNLHRETITIEAGEPVYIRCNEPQYLALGWQDRAKLMAAALHLKQNGNKEKSFSANQLLDIIQSKFAQDVTGLRQQLPGNTVVRMAPIFTRLRLHQLDDYLFQVNRSRLHYAAMHYINRMNEGAGTDPSELIIPDASFDQPIPFDVLAREITLAYQQGQSLCAELLKWERRVIDDYCLEILGRQDDDAKQQLLINEFQQTTDQKKKNARYYLEFSNVCKMADKKLKNSNMTENELRGIRNAVLHSLIPVTGSFNQQAMPGTSLGHLLQIMAPIATPKDRSRYITKNEGGEEQQA